MARERGCDLYKFLRSYFNIVDLIKKEEEFKTIYRK